MHVGALMFVTEHALPVTDLARAMEERGFESLWLPEHPVVPVHYETRYPLSADGKLPRPYTELPDVFALLAAAAAATRTLRVATGICLVPERDPLLTAHQVATLDWLSNGRFLFGIGAGWLREEMALFTPHFEHSDVLVVRRASLDAHPPWRRVTSRVNRVLLRLLFAPRARDLNFVQFYRRSFAQAVTLVSTSPAFVTPELILRAERGGWRVREVTAEFRRRERGTGHFGRPSDIAWTLRDMGRLRLHTWLRGWRA